MSLSDKQIDLVRDELAGMMLAKLNMMFGPQLKLDYGHDLLKRDAWYYCSSYLETRKGLLRRSCEHGFCKNHRHKNRRRHDACQ
jgi:hypothetical protein